LQKFALWKSALTATQIKNHYLAWVANSSYTDRVTRTDVEFAYTPTTTFTPFPPKLVRAGARLLIELDGDDEPALRRVPVYAPASVFTPVGLPWRRYRELEDEAREWLDALPDYARRNLIAALAASSGGVTAPNYKPILVVTNSN